MTFSLGTRRPLTTYTPVSDRATYVSKKRAKPRVERQEPRCRRVDLAWNKAHGARVEFLETVWSMDLGWPTSTWVVAKTQQHKQI